VTAEEVHRVAGVECHPAPEGWLDALGVLVVALALTAIPQCVWNWISRRERLCRALGLDDPGGN
jgi:hypothetical protein